MKKHDHEVLFTICCVVSCGAVLSLLVKEPSLGNASAALTEVLIGSAFCLYQLLISSFKEKEVVLIVPLQAQELLNNPVASEVCITFFKIMFPSTDEEHIRYQLQELIHDSQFTQLCSQSLLILGLIVNQVINYELQSCNVSQHHQFQEYELD